MSVIKISKNTGFGFLTLQSEEISIASKFYTHRQRTIPAIEILPAQSFIL